MSKRLQVILDDAEYEAVERAARHRRMTVSEWVRQSLRKVRREEPEGDPGRKIQMVREAARHSYPTAPPEQMVDEIRQGYIGPEVPEP